MTTAATEPAPRPHASEPSFGPWGVLAVADLLRSVGYPDTLNRTEPGVDGARPFVLAVDGRGAGGKSTLAVQIVAATPGAALLHTDDLAWHEPFFEWGHLLREVLAAVRTGGAVEYRPPAWERMGRAGSLPFRAGLTLLVVEGVGASQRDVVDLIDATVWVQSDWAEAERRGIERDVEQGVNGNREETIEFWFEWMAHEVAFFERDRPWERADAVVLGTPGPGMHAPLTGVIVSAVPPQSKRGPGSSGGR